MPPNKEIGDGPLLPICAGVSTGSGVIIEVLDVVDCTLQPVRSHQHRFAVLHKNMWGEREREEEDAGMKERACEG